MFSNEQVLEQAQKLGMRERSWVIKKLLGTLSVGQLDEVQAELTQYRITILEEERKALLETMQNNVIDKIKSRRNETLPVEIVVQKHHFSKVKLVLEQWVELSKLLANTTQSRVIHENGRTVLTDVKVLKNTNQLGVIHENGRIVLIDANAKILVEYTSNFGTLRVNSISYLKKLLRVIATYVITSNSSHPQLKQEDKSLAAQWLAMIGSVPRPDEENDEQTLAELFHL